MANDDANFLKRLLQTFSVEASEHVLSLSSGLLELEKAERAQHPAIIENIFRCAHSLKGAARSVNLPEIETICQSLETYFSSLKQNEISLTPDLLDTLHRSVDALRETLGKSAGSSNSSIKTSEQLEDSRPLVPSPNRDQRHAGESQEKRESTEQHKIVKQTIRISNDTLNAALLQAEELISSKLTANQQLEVVRSLSSEVFRWRKEWDQVYPALKNLRQKFEGKEIDDYETQRVLAFSEQQDTHFRSLTLIVGNVEKSLERDCRALGIMVDGLVANIREMAMLPFSSVSILLRKIARDLGRAQGKLITLLIEGGDLEIDRRILEGLKDPLVHIVRNCIDHGIETPEIREKAGKPNFGTLTISIQRIDGKIEICVSDDGAGINADEVIQNAIANRIISGAERQNLNANDAYDLVFRSGISTRPTVTTISGRGLGLAIAREKVEQLGGKISVENKAGKGVTFRMLLPVSQSTFRGAIFRVAGRQFVIPTAFIELVVKVRANDIKTIENREILFIDDRILPLLGLDTVLGLRPGKNQSHIAVVINCSGQRVAFKVDEVEREQELILKNTGKQLIRVFNIAGATFLGTGTIVPVLNAADLVKAVPHAKSIPSVESSESMEAKTSILVADDSITSRFLIKNILETNGYTVDTAVDGLEAFTKIKCGNFKLVVSDVEMPRLDGFELTAKIRGDKNLAALPVILVTALSSPQHRERGIDVGADAYLVKSSFDQSDLLQAVQRLL